MNLIWVPLLPLLGTLIPLLLGRYPRSMLALGTAFLPAVALGIVIHLIPQVMAGDYPVVSFEWIPLLSLNISFFLDGLGLMFCLLILGIGLLVILYARYYLAEGDNAGDRKSVV